MIASQDEARLLFAKLQEESLPLRIKLLSSTLIFDGIGVVLAFSPESVRLGGDSWQFTVPLGDGGVSFSDPREIPMESVRASEAAQYELGLSLDLPNGDRLALMELKTSQAQDQPGSNS